MIEMTEWFVLERTLNTVLFQTPSHRQGHLPLDRVAQSPSNLVLDTVRERASTAPLDNLCQ